MTSALDPAAFDLESARALFWEAVALDRKLIDPADPSPLRQGLVDLVSRCTYLLTRLEQASHTDPEAIELRVPVASLLCGAAARLALLDDDATTLWIGMALEHGERALAVARALPPSHSTQQALRKLLNALLAAAFVTTEPQGTLLKSLVARYEQQIDSGFAAVSEHDDQGLEALNRALIFEAYAEDIDDARDRLLVLHRAEAAYREALAAFERSGNGDFYLRADAGLRILIDEHLIPAERQVAAHARSAAQPIAVACPKCGSSSGGTLTTCLRCGEALPPVAAPPPEPAVATVEPAEPTLACPNCGRQVNATARFCPACGSTVAVDEVCPSCGTKRRPGARFCGSCGRAFA